LNIEHRTLNIEPEGDPPLQVVTISAKPNDFEVKVVTKVVTFLAEVVTGLGQKHFGPASKSE
jgi:hypothetical protein